MFSLCCLIVLFILQKYILLKKTNIILKEKTGRIRGIFVLAIDSDFAEAVLGWIIS